LEDKKVGGLIDNSTWMTSVRVPGSRTILSRELSCDSSDPIRMSEAKNLCVAGLAQKISFSKLASRISLALLYASFSSFAPPRLEHNNKAEKDE
jgi:hypothetical protein